MSQSNKFASCCWRRGLYVIWSHLWLMPYWPQPIKQEWLSYYVPIIPDLQRVGILVTPTHFILFFFFRLTASSALCPSFSQRRLCIEGGGNSDLYAGGVSTLCLTVDIFPLDRSSKATTKQNMSRSVAHVSRIWHRRFSVSWVTTSCWWKHAGTLNLTWMILCIIISYYAQAILDRFKCNWPVYT